MAANPNTLTIQAIWSRIYQISHYTQPVFRAFATERLAKTLKMGDTVHRDYISDFLVNDLGGNGSYVTQAVTDTDETLAVDTKKEVSMQLPEWQDLQLHLPTAEKFARKAMNSLWRSVDATLIKAMLTATGITTVDDGSIGGTAGYPITIGTGNVMNVFAAAQQALQLNNVNYTPNKMFTGDIKKDQGDLMSCAAISPQVYSQLAQFVGGKNSAKGDEVTTNGYIGYFFGFNNFVSNNLLWEGKLALSVVPTANDTFTLLSGVTVGGVSQSLVYKYVAATSAAGDLIVANSAGNGATNTVNALNAPYTAITDSASAGYKAWTQSSLTFTQQYLLSNLVASVVSTTTVKILIAGFSSLPVTKSMTSASNVWSTQIQHCLFGTSQSIDLIMQKTPNLSKRPVSGVLAYDYVTWNLFGKKVFTDQVPQIIDVQIDASTSIFAAASTPKVAWN